LLFILSNDKRVSLLSIIRETIFNENSKIIHIGYWLIGNLYYTSDWSATSQISDLHKQIENEILDFTISNQEDIISNFESKSLLLKTNNNLKMSVFALASLCTNDYLLNEQRVTIYYVIFIFLVMENTKHLLRNS